MSRILADLAFWDWRVIDTLGCRLFSHSPVLWVQDMPASSGRSGAPGDMATLQCRAEQLADPLPCCPASGPGPAGCQGRPGRTPLFRGSSQEEYALRPASWPGPSRATAWACLVAWTVSILPHRPFVSGRLAPFALQLQLCLLWPHV